MIPRLKTERRGGIGRRPFPAGLRVRSVCASRTFDWAGLAAHSLACPLWWSPPPGGGRQLPRPSGFPAGLVRPGGIAPPAPASVAPGALFGASLPSPLIIGAPWLGSRALRARWPLPSGIAPLAAMPRRVPWGARGLASHWFRGRLCARRGGLRRLSCGAASPGLGPAHLAFVGWQALLLHSFPSCGTVAHPFDSRLRAALRSLGRGRRAPCLRPACRLRSAQPVRALPSRLFMLPLGGSPSISRLLAPARVTCGPPSLGLNTHSGPSPLYTARFPLSTRRPALLASLSACFPIARCARLCGAPLSLEAVRSVFRLLAVSSSCARPRRRVQPARRGGCCCRGCLPAPWHPPWRLPVFLLREFAGRRLLLGGLRARGSALALSLLPLRESVGPGPRACGRLFHPPHRPLCRLHTARRVCPVFRPLLVFCR